ncbi:MAG TPA: CD1871A family CXXC motif-containing protein [Clostridia bacterium]|nr:CD1871A family CXXC motif-containing protein [Clostridia bacterium]
MNSKSRFLLFSAAFALGIAFLLFGIYRGEVAVVLKKAISICLECIGIG